MPEIKNQFTGGKMNQDLDERLIPNGEYREAMNIQVANSEGSDVGTAQNILGNKNRPLTLKSGPTQFDVNFIMSDGAVCVGSISDEKNDTMYYLVWSEEADFIIQWDGSTNKPVFIDKDKSVLKFTNDMVITGINVIDGMLFWTDNINEPRKINIQRCIKGTSTGSNLLQTRLYNANLLDPDNFVYYSELEEKHITVVKKAPQFAPDIKLHTSREIDRVYTAVMEISSSSDTDGSDSGFAGNTSAYNDFSSVTTEDDGSNIIDIRLSEVILNNELLTNTNVDPYPSGSTVVTANVPNQASAARAEHALTGWIGNPIPMPSPEYAAVVGKKVVFQAFDVDPISGEQTPPGLPLTDFALKGVITDDGVGSANYDLRIRITTIDGFPPQAAEGETLKYAIDLFDEQEKLFEFKFPRFSYRYKFQDGEYSAFAPFTQVAFAPGAFDYHPRKGYNIGMTNKLSKVEILNIITKETPKDVVAVDVLFKDDSSPSVYVVDTIKPDDYASGVILIPNVGNRPDNTWNRMIVSHSDPTHTPQASFVIEKEAISSIVPSNQLLRPWDNVPKKALAQDISGNRIVYANYVQNYDLLTSDGNKYVPGFNVTTDEDVLSSQNILEPTTNRSSGTFKSIKSLREYQLGVVFLDEYGRETPVISNASGSTRINKIDAENANRFGVEFSSDDYPQSLTHFKFFVKETSSEYYNMAMDRWYSAGDGNVWLAFPSSDRNKIDIDTFLILKKGSDQDTLVKDPARYKVLAIENEAPDFVKTTKRLVVTNQHNSSFLTTTIFDTLASLPFEGESEFTMQYAAFHGTSGANIADTEDEVYIQFGKVGSDLVSDRYKINSITNSWDGTTTPDAEDVFSLKLNRNLEDDVNFITDGTIINNGILVMIYKYKVENLEKFDGRFFVKIYFDEVFRNNIEVTTTGGGFRRVAKKEVYSMDMDLVRKHTSDLGQFLTRGNGDTADDMKDSWYPSHYQGTRFTSTSFGNGYGYSTNSKMMQYGYYTVDEFTANALYFRRYREKRYAHGGGADDYGVTQQNTGNQNVGHWLDKLNIDRKVRALVHLIPGGYYNGPNIDWNIATTGNMGDAAWLGKHIPHKKRNRQGGVEYWKDAPAWWREFGYKTHAYSVTRRAEGYINDATRGVTSGWRGGYQNVAVTATGHLSWYIEDNTWQAYASDKSAVRDSEVWFMDGGPNKGRNTSGDALKFDGANSSQESQGHGIHHVYNNNFKMHIGFGGIESNYSASAHPYNPTHQPSFWNVGDWNQSGAANGAYNDTVTKKFINSFTPGGRFRFQQDPTGQVYTILGNVSQSDLFRHSHGPLLPGWTGANGSASSKRGAYSNSPLSATDDDASILDLRSMAELLSFNMTKRWDLDGIEPSMLDNWNPTADGVIPDGISINLEIVNDQGYESGGTTVQGTIASGQHANDLQVYVRSLSGIDNNTGESATLHEGMALTSYIKDGGDQVNLESTQLFVIRQITEFEAGSTGTKYYQLRLGGWSRPFTQANHDTLIDAPPLHGDNNATFKQVGMNGYSPNSEFNINTMSRYCSESGSGGEPWDYGGNDLGAITAVGYTMEFVEEIDPIEILSENPAIFETEPKDITELDIYYEASGSIPAKITEDTIASAFPIGTKFLIGAGNSYTVVDYDGNRLIVHGVNYPPVEATAAPFYYQPAGGTTKFFRPDDLVITTAITGVVDGTPPANNHANTGLVYIELENKSLNPLHDKDLIDNKFILPWHNCYTFRNGVESNRIRDNFNLPFISNGVKASTTLEQEYKEEHRKYGLIYSGIYNSTSGINNLNQFIAGEKITKDVNPIYGSIQKLYSRDSDLVTLCEDKILRIYANKDALFNADGNSNVIATDRVLGQTIPFSGEYGISTNPESFASESYRAYFTDKVRGAVIRMSMDGLTPISSAGMKDYFRDNLKTAKRLLGSYDDRNGEYNLALNFENRTQFLPATNDLPKQYEGKENNKVLTFSEKVGGWVSFKSFTDMQGGISLANEYYTFKGGVLFLHYFNNNNENTRNTFYGVFTPSTIDVVLNQDPGSVKEFTTLNYEGSQSKVDKFTEEKLIIPEQPDTTYNDQAYYNLEPKDGWHVESITTNKEEGYVNEFLEKEGKWFNGINKKVDIEGVADAADFTFQGIGMIYSIPTADKKETILDFKLSGLNVSLQVGDLIYARATYRQLGTGYLGSEGIREDLKSLGNLEGTASLIGTLTKIEDYGGLTRLYIRSFEGSQYLNSEPGDFAMFSKYNQSMGNVLGYYAKIKFVNSSHKKAEMFSVGSEVIINSK